MKLYINETLDNFYLPFYHLRNNQNKSQIFHSPSQLSLHATL